MRSVFKSPELKNYELNDAIKDNTISIPLSDEIKVLMSKLEKSGQIPGAFQ